MMLPASNATAHGERTNVVFPNVGITDRRRERDAHAPAVETAQGTLSVNVTSMSVSAVHDAAVAGFVTPS